MTGRRSVQPIERVHYHIDGRIESERRRRGLEVVVDGFGDTDAIDPGLL